MSLGLPAHLARESNARALAAGSRIAAVVCLVAAAASILLPGLLYGAVVPWWAVLGLLPMAVLLLVLRRRGGAPFTVAYLLIGAGSTFVYTFALLTQTSTYRTTDLFVVALPVVALTLVGGARIGIEAGTGATASASAETGAFAGVLWATIGYLLGELGVFLAALAADREFRFEAMTLGAYLFLVVVLGFEGITRNTNRDAQALILRTMRAEQAAAIRHEAVEDAVRELHDGILSQLGLLAGSSPGPLSPELRARLSDDLARWSVDPEVLPSVTSRAADADAVWGSSELATAIEEARDAGLSVDVTGDRTALAPLASQRSSAVALAVRQCLVNVLRHSGVLEAEVAISQTDGDVSIMVVDAGRGFDQSAVGDERLGLRHSVRGRIERTGGSVTVFSSPGAGTSVLIRLPAEPAAPGPTRPDGDARLDGGPA
jgi:Signal transduction histidine kinase